MNEFVSLIVGIMIGFGIACLGQSIYDAQKLNEIKFCEKHLPRNQRCILVAEPLGDNQ